MEPRRSRSLFADAKKIERSDKAKQLIALNKNELTKLIRHVYQATQNIDHTAHFIDQLYFLNLSVVNIITKGKIDHYDPYLKEEIVRLVFSDLFVKPSLFPGFLKKELASLYLALTEQRDNLSDELLPLIKAHSTKHFDASDHFMQTCNDRADLIKDFIQFGLAEPTFISDEKPTKEHHAKAIAYLKDFYSAKSLKRCLPKELESYEEKTIASLIDTYAELTHSDTALSSFLAFFRTKPLPSATELLLTIRKTILAYQTKYTDLPEHLSQMLQRINGLIPMEKQFTHYPPTHHAKSFSKTP